MPQEDDKGFFDRLGEVLNAPLPGTRRPEERSRVPVDDDDDESLLERIKDILQAPLPGTAQTENDNQTQASTQQPEPGATPGASERRAGTAASQPHEQTPELDEDELDEAWWQQDWAGFRAHQERERSGIELKQRRDLEQFAAYQGQEKQRFDTHQQQEREAFTRQQQWRLNAWKQAVANSPPGHKPPPPPWDMPPGAQAGFPVTAPPWMRPPDQGGRRS